MGDDIIGKRFGKLVVLSFKKEPRKAAMYCLQCDCGNIKYAAKQHFTKRTMKCCGCSRRNFPRIEALERGGEFYFSGKPCIRGHIGKRRTRNNNCLVCERDLQNIWYKENPEKRRQHNWNKRENDPKGWIINSVRGRAKSHNIKFSITRDDFEIPDKCPCCGRGIFFAIDRGKPNYNSPSLDRLDSNRGYIQGNVNVICWRCNTIKSNASVDELRTIATWMECMWQRTR